ncbi:uncharacterized protein STEHIDRAFT_161907 [Stereum hirsutum FP-91666 SS1]|uniref:uncharacterized protein n=1 Tax=Stereum hirsutum (strain FP-91666) TaxID=721885 RepID=UPI000444A426|nr:uncharacterized protein STEHIDRAFT_161907 [Stereum hirsutum FP-91666 SS1]EIM81741.1 hypothetical protein STEHIDRAFT_161907 [Stereum hirsutum FP-91666 SS1]
MRFLNKVPQDGTQVTEKANIPWKEQVIGYAQKTRGTVLGKNGLKDHGDQILQGETTAREPPPKA